MKFIVLFEKFKEFNNEIIIPKEYMDFISMLQSNGVETDQYGKDIYKTVGHLFNEIKEGECKLSKVDDDLIREVNFVGARIIYKKNGEWLRLYEEKQIFKDGRIRRRKAMPYSAAEKFKFGEDPKEVIIRGMKEELNIDLGIDQFVFFNKTKFENNNDYPGIISYHTGYEFLVVLNNDQFKEEGYIENQIDKDVYFTWKKIERSVKESKFWNLDLIKGE